MRQVPAANALASCAHFDASHFLCVSSTHAPPHPILQPRFHPPTLAPPTPCSCQAECLADGAGEISVPDSLKGPSGRKGGSGMKRRRATSDAGLPAAGEAEDEGGADAELERGGRGGSGDVHYGVHHGVARFATSSQKIQPQAQTPTHAEGFNLHTSSQSKTGYKGVYLISKPHVEDKFRTEFNKKFLGCFDTAVEGAVAYARYHSGSSLRLCLSRCTVALLYPH